MKIMNMIGGLTILAAFCLGTGCGSKEGSSEPVAQTPQKSNDTAVVQVMQPSAASTKPVDNTALDTLQKTNLVAATNASQTLTQQVARISNAANPMVSQLQPTGTALAQNATDALKQQSNALAQTASQAALGQLAQGTSMVAKAVSGTVQAVIDNAKKLVSESKYAEALKDVNDLSAQNLTPEQQKVVSTLKDQITKAISTNATSEAQKALGNLLTPGK